MSVVGNTADYDNDGSTLLGYNVDKGNQAPNCGGSVIAQDYNLI